MEAAPDDISPDDRLAASVFAAGLLLNFVRREDVVRWADRRIEALPTAPAWLMDLSLSQDTHPADLVSLLRRVGAGVDPVATCEAILALYPEVEAPSFDGAAKLAEGLYRLVSECLGWDWKYPLRAEVDDVTDSFDFARDGYLDASPDEAVEQFRRFIERHRDDRIVKLLHPVVWSAPPR